MHSFIIEKVEENDHEEQSVEIEPVSRRKEHFHTSSQKEKGTLIKRTGHEKKSTENKEYYQATPETHKSSRRESSSIGEKVLVTQKK